MDSVIEQQYYLAKMGNISVVDSGDLIDFERDIYYSLLVRDAKREIEEVNKYKRDK